MRFFLVFIFPFLSQAEYLIGYGTGSYLGRHQLQGEWISENKWHHLLGIIGYTQDENIGSIRQASVIYLQGGQQIEFENFKWTPILAGVFATYSAHKLFYFKAPSKYKDPDYYDVTNARFGLKFASELTLLRKSEKIIRLSIDGSLLGEAVVALYNNVSELNILPAFWSLGVSVRTEF